MAKHIGITVGAITLAIGGLALGQLPTAQAAAPSARVTAASKHPARIMSGWLPYWTTNQSTQSFLANADLFSDISPFWHNAVASSKTGSGITIENNVSGSTRSATLAKLKGHHVAVVPSITDGAGRGRMAAAMKNPRTRAALVSQIVSLVVVNKYDGIDLDFETFAFSDGYSSWASTRPAWVSFVKQLGTALHARHKMLTVAVPPMYNAKRNGTSGYWVYDFKGIAKSVNRVRVMAYDYSWSTPGPIGGPLSWADMVTKFGVSQVPSRKFQLGTPTYGRDWVVKKTGYGCPSTSQKVYDSRNLATAIPGIGASSWKRDAASRERYVNYSVTYNNGNCTVSRSAWLPDASTVLAHERIAAKYHARGIATWTIGGEDQSQWGKLRSYAKRLSR